MINLIPWTRKFSCLFLVGLLASCGGGGGSNTSGSTANTASLSEDQRLFESFYLQSNGGAYYFNWDYVDNPSQSYADLLPTITNSSAKDNIYESRISIMQSPLNYGPQTQMREHFQGNEKVAETQRYYAYLVNGAIVYSMVPESETKPYRYSYVGNTIRVDGIATDNKTIVFSNQIENLRSGDLTGGLINTPMEAIVFYADLAQYLAYKKSQASYLPGAKYLLASERLLTDIFGLRNCTYPARLSAANVVPCVEGSNLQDALSKGIKVDSTTYFMKDGALIQAAGATLWIADAFLPVDGNQKTNRFFVAIGGKIYTGTFTKAGQILDGDYVIDRNAGKATQLDKSIYLNKPARDSLVNAILNH